MRIHIVLTGTSPLLFHNPQLADPDNEITKEIGKITAKRKKTEDDRLQIAKLEWYGGLYLSDDTVVVPTAHLRKSFINSGKITKQGITVQRALSFAAFQVPLGYDGPKDIDKLFNNPAYCDKRAVGIGNKKTMRTRPKFPQWAVEADAEFLENVMDFEDLLAVVDRAGVAEGIGDGRAIGFGKFEAKVEVV